METLRIRTALLEANHGQLNGLPANPRKVTKEKFEELKKSIRSSPEMLNLREPIVFPLENGHYIAIGGNMRILACKELGIESLLCKVLPRDTPIEKLREYTIKDNNSAGVDDWTVIAEEWDVDEVMSWGVIADEGWQQIKKERTVDSSSCLRKTKGLNWGRGGDESRCNLVSHIAVHERYGTLILSSFRKTREGTPLSVIKKEPENVKLFADEAVRMIRGILGLHEVTGIALITAPKRRHKRVNFSEMVCREISARTGLRFYPGAIRSHNRDRLHPIFTLETCIMEPLVILYDDILTTGSTVKHVLEHLENKNTIVIIGINNH